MIGTAITIIVTLVQSAFSHATSPSKIAIPSAIWTFLSQRHPRCTRPSISRSTVPRGCADPDFPGSLEGGPKGLRDSTLLEQSIHGWSRAADVGPERSELLELGGERGRGEVVLREGAQVASRDRLMERPAAFVEATLAAALVECLVHGGRRLLRRTVRKHEQHRVLGGQVDPSHGRAVAGAEQRPGWVKEERDVGADVGCQLAQWFR